MLAVVSDRGGITPEIREKVRVEMERRDAHGDAIDERVLAAIEVLPVAALRELARLYVGEVGYLGEHHPDEREGGVKRFPCSDQGWHLCSFGGRHDPRCRAVGGDGDVSANGESAQSCAWDCDEAAATGQQWCHCNGFDCPTCGMLDGLLALLAANGA